jgi:serine/threonine protein kinase
MFSGRWILDNRYQILRRIGHGGFSHAYLARDHRLGRDVVAKVLRGELMYDRAARHRFEREARIALSVSGSNIVDIYDFGLADHRPVIVSQYIDGVDLSRVIRPQMGLRVEDAISITLDILAGLDTLHRAGVQHRDIKPQNILLPKWDAPAKLTDFGISRGQNDPRVTEPGLVLGSPTYMSPEQASGEEVTFATDIYSASIVLYELLTGTVPFKGDTASQTMMKHLTATPPPPRYLNLSIPEKLEQIVLSGLAKSPQNRFPSAREMADHLRALRDTNDISQSASSTPRTDIMPKPVRDPRMFRWSPSANEEPTTVTQSVSVDSGRKRGFRRKQKRTPLRSRSAVSRSQTGRRASWLGRTSRRIPKYPLILAIVITLTITLLAVTQGGTSSLDLGEPSSDRSIEASDSSSEPIISDHRELLIQEPDLPEEWATLVSMTEGSSDDPLPHEYDVPSEVECITGMKPAEFDLEPSRTIVQSLEIPRGNMIDQELLLFDDAASARSYIASQSEFYACEQMEFVYDREVMRVSVHPAHPHVIGDDTITADLSMTLLSPEGVTKGKIFGEVHVSRIANVISVVTMWAFEPDLETRLFDLIGSTTYSRYENTVLSN